MKRKSPVSKKTAAKMTAVKKTADPSLPLLRLIVSSLEEKKAEDLRVLDVRAQSSITDYLVIATGTSDPHLRALRVELEKTLDSAHALIVGTESRQGSGWTVFDAFDIMVHLFTTENRDKYRLEQLWKDAVEIPVAGLVAQQKAPRRKRAPAKKTIAEKISAGPSQT
jgi:ribosome-associated protein